MSCFRKEKKGLLLAVDLLFLLSFVFIVVAMLLRSYPIFFGLICFFFHFIFLLGADLNVRDRSLNTPLHFAVQKGHLRCVYILLRAGADPMLRTKWGQSPYDVAKYKNYMRIARLFENGDNEFDIINLFVDRKWYKVDVHLVRHGKTMGLPIDDTMFYVKTKYRTKAHVHHPDLH